MDKPNTRSRKSLDFMKPYEVFFGHQPIALKYPSINNLAKLAPSQPPPNSMLLAFGGTEGGRLQNHFTIIKMLKNFCSGLTT